MTPIRPWSLAAVAVCCAALAWLVIRLAYSSFPPLPWTSVPALLLLAIAEAWSGRNLRARILGRPGSKPLVPIAVARMAVLAKASAMVAAIFGGFAAGFLIYLASLISKPSRAMTRSPREPRWSAPPSWRPRPCISSAAAGHPICRRDRPGVARSRRTGGRPSIC